MNIINKDTSVSYTVEIKNTFSRNIFRLFFSGATSKSRLMAVLRE